MNSKNSNKKQPKKLDKASFFSLLRYANGIEKVYMTIGAIAALGSGIKIISISLYIFLYIKVLLFLYFLSFLEMFFILFSQALLS